AAEQYRASGPSFEEHEFVVHGQALGMAIPGEDDDCRLQRALHALRHTAQRIMGQDLDLDTHACKPCQKPRHGAIAKMRSGDANTISGGLAKCCQNYIAPAAGKEPDAEFGRVISGVQIRAEPFENAVGSVVHGIEMRAHKSDRRHGSDLDQKIMAAILIADVAEEFRRINSTA